MDSNQAAGIYVASLIINCTGGIFKPTGEVIGKEETSVILRHGPYNYSIYSSGGGWILLAPSLAAVKEVISRTVNPGQILAVATIERQWEVKEGKGLETAAALARMLTPQIPGYHSLSQTRSTEITMDIEKLCAVYIERENKFRNFTIETLPIDRRAFSTGEKDSNAVIFSGHDSIHRLNGQPGHQVQKELLDLLAYYWESVFMIWWKGFW
ncbi:MAG: hypothetical protein GY950_28650 [bacterium]|nr:hypothetical protein [bacterium]